MSIPQAEVDRMNAQAETDRLSERYGGFSQQQLATMLETLQSQVKQLRDSGSRYGPLWSIDNREAIAFAHCPDPLCAGVRQVPVPVIVQTCTSTFGQRSQGAGGTAVDNMYSPFTENSYEYLNFLVESDRRCPDCGLRDRELATQVRPKYERLQRDVPQDALISMRRESADVDQQQAQTVQMLQAQVQALTTALAHNQAPPTFNPGGGSMSAETFEAMVHSGRSAPGVRERANGRWRIDWRDENGKMKGETHDTYEEAVREREGRLREVAEAKARKAL